MTKFIATLVALTISLPQVFAAQPEKLDYFVFLTTGKSTEGTAKEDVQKMQMAHLANFTRLAGIGELSAAGPCVDPDKTIRGIVVINASSIADAESKFKPDPYVSGGFMKAEMHQFNKIAGKLVIPEDITKLDKYTLVIARRGPKWPSQPNDALALNEKLKTVATEQHAAGKLGFAALFADQQNNEAPRIAVMIFRGDDTADVEKIVKASGLASEQTVEFQVFPQYLVKDAMPK